MEMLLQVGYVGNRSRHFSVLENLNEMQPGTYGSCLGAQGIQLTTCPYQFSSDVGNATTSVVPAAAIVPYPGFSNSQFTYQSDIGTSSYNSLQVSLQKRMSHNLMFTGAYTYANANDIGSELQDSIVDHNNPEYNRSEPDWMRHQVFTGTYEYDLPFYKRQTSVVGNVLGGWSVNGVFSAQTGNVNTVNDEGEDVAGLGADGGEHAQLVSGCNPNSGPRTKMAWFNTACYINPSAAASAGSNNFLEPRGTLGDSGRNSLYGPGYWVWDAGLHKNGKVVGDRLQYQFRAEGYNVLNHPAKNGIDSGVNDGTFGIVNSVYQPTSGAQRNLQLAMRLIF
jgi:hypothetical protein